VIDHAGRPEQRWEGARLLMRVPLSAQRSEPADDARGAGGAGRARRGRASDSQ
jgi:hypothetical protein